MTQIDGIINLNYEGNEIPFRIDENGEVFMNATEMAKPFGRSKRVGNFLRGKDLLAYINALHESKSMSQIRDINESSLIQTIRGRGRGEDSGTWMQENLALRFAQWLNPKVSVWCDERIKEIITKGFTALTPEGTDYIDKAVGVEVEMLNDIEKHIREGKSKPGGPSKDYYLCDVRRSKFLIDKSCLLH